MYYKNVDNYIYKLEVLSNEKNKIGYSDFILPSIIAGFYGANGLKSKGTAIRIQIINKIDDYTKDIYKRNLLVWNLYNLTKEFIEHGDNERALLILKRAENNWSRDLILGDDLGFFHVSWIEQIWLLRARIFYETGNSRLFFKIANSIIEKRLRLIIKEIELSGNKILLDRCLYECFELMAMVYKRNRDINNAIATIKKAMVYRGYSFNKANRKLIKCKGNALNSSFDMHLRLFYKLPEYSYDTLKYGYCISCINFKADGGCIRHGIKASSEKACTNYEYKKGNP